MSDDRRDRAAGHLHKHAEAIRLRHLRLAGNPAWPGPKLLHEIAVEIQAACSVTAFKAHRLARGWTVVEAVQSFHEMCRTEGIKPRGLVARSWLEWEAGGRPSWDYQDLLSRLLHSNPVRLGWARDYTPAEPTHDAVDVTETLRTRWPGASLVMTPQPLPSGPDGGSFFLPGGRTLAGVATTVQAHAAENGPDGVVSLKPADSTQLLGFVRHPQSGLLLGVRPAEDDVHLYAIDARKAVRCSGRPQVNIPIAYELDDLTFAVLWAVRNLDEALLADDLALSESRPRLTPYERLDSSSVSRAAASELGPVSLGWVGSEFCARHIMRYLTASGEVPVFWTREQRGEEASVWLFYRHKYEYLRRIREYYGSAPLGRAFCVPEDVVRLSPAYERVLFFLAVALMESFDISTWLCVEPEYSETDGFALVPGRQAIVATWVRTDGIWHVDRTDRRPALREFTDVTTDVKNASVIDAADPAERLILLAEYLELDIDWLTRRCRSLARFGWDRLATPRSRLLSLEGLEAACSFVGRLPVRSRRAG